MPNVVITAGGIPPDTFDLISWKNNRIVNFRNVDNPWNWTARAYILDDEQFYGPLWS